MNETMTLDEVRDWHRGCQQAAEADAHHKAASTHKELADAIDAAIKSRDASEPFGWIDPATLESPRPVCIKRLEYRSISDTVAGVQFVPVYTAPPAPAAQVTDDLHPTTADLITRFASALREKLLAAQNKYGYSDGWTHPDWMDECRQHLLDHVAKGDPRDVAAYCAFLWHHGQRTALTPKEPQA